MKPRKLLTKEALEKAMYQVDLGVPLQRVIKNLDLDMTGPTLFNLLLAYTEGSDNSKVLGSLFPPWLDQNGPASQEQPAEYSYSGHFPYGVWECKI